MKLKQLSPGQEAIIRKCSKNIPLKLIEMGLTEGQKVRKIAHVPLGGADIYKVGNSLIAIDEQLSDEIEVTQPSPSNAASVNENA